jgi:hypothetical protein
MPNPYANLQQFDIAGNTQNALLQGMQVGAAMRQRKQAEESKKAEDDFYRAKIGGDPNQISTAQNALATYNPKAVYGMRAIEREAQTRAAVATGQAPASALAAINWDDYAKLTADQAAIAKQNVETIGQMALMADTPQKWDATIDQLGPQFAQYKGQFGQREAMIARAGQVKEFLDQQAPKYQVIPEGGTLVNTRDPAALQQVANGQTAPQGDLEAQAQAAIAAGADPEKVRARMQELGGQAKPSPATFSGWY